jgi:hypothetical protein
MNIKYDLNAKGNNLIEERDKEKRTSKKGRERVNECCSIRE